MRAMDKRKEHALEEVVKLMEAGEVGLLGQVVEVIARSQDREAAITHLQKMEDLIVMETKKKRKSALEVNANQ